MSVSTSAPALMPELKFFQFSGLSDRGTIELGECIAIGSPLRALGPSVGTTDLLTERLTTGTEAEYVSSMREGSRLTDSSGCVG
eukprot:CAMPEP_0170504810 /NCGR_PEP_ID=MMETSP0208-20121228/48986_1 /TAXON_ID=197538 /ORGANISM="Strombidium inclinatum, Strain S3" /LENGTH=83 /DNA_ID=CAMNT_0010785263 /DNA_START=530 /DNA_END=781 /DNA_ORIENTATION=-